MGGKFQGAFKSIFIQRQEIGKLMFVPKLSEQITQNELFTYARRGKNQLFGIISFNLNYLQIIIIWFVSRRLRKFTQKKVFI